MATSGIDVSVDKDSLNQLTNFLALVKGTSPNLVAKSINKAMTQSKTEMKREIGKKANIGATKIGKRIAIARKASQLKLQGLIKPDGVDIGIENFTGTRWSSAKGRLRFQLFKDKVREEYRHVFPFLTSGGGTIFMERNIISPRYDGRLPLSRTVGPSIADFYANTKGVDEQVRSFASIAMANEINRLIEVELFK